MSRGDGMLKGIPAGVRGVFAGVQPLGCAVRGDAQCSPSASSGSCPFSFSLLLDNLGLKLFTLGRLQFEAFMGY